VAVAALGGGLLWFVANLLLLGLGFRIDEVAA
jgi:hypothetical protein